MMKTLMLAGVFGLAGLGLASAQPSSPHPSCKDDPAYHAQDYVLGKWTAYRRRGGVEEKTADVEMTSILGSCAIEERWTVPDGKTGNVVALLSYSPILKAWLYAFSTDYANNNYFTGQAEPSGQVRYTTERLMPDGTRRLRRWSLIKMPDGSVNEHSEKSDDQGKTWAVEYDFFWKRDG